MKYFTPKLYLRFNSAEPTVVGRAHEDWETALEKYQKHLNEIASRLTPSVRRLAKTLCLHDAAYLGLGRPKIPGLHHSIAVLATRKNATAFLLVYMLAKEPKFREVGEQWPFSKKTVHWLYDEFDIDSDGNQQHEVLLSNGKSITFQFKDVQLIKDHVDINLDVA
jgi:hypothetical protein